MENKIYGNKSNTTKKKSKSKSFATDSLFHSLNNPKTISRHKQFQVMMNDFANKQDQDNEKDKDSSYKQIQLPVIANIHSQNLKNQNSSNTSRVHINQGYSLQTTTNGTSQKQQQHYGDNNSTQQHNESHDQTFLAQSIQHDETLDNNYSSSNKNLINNAQKRSKSQLEQIQHSYRQNQSLKTKKKNGSVQYKGVTQQKFLNNLRKDSNKHMTETNETRQSLSKKQFYETFNPNSKPEIQSISTADDFKMKSFNTNNNQNNIIDSSIYHQKLSVKTAKSNNSYLEINKKKIYGKLIDQDYVPGPGQYNIKGSFQGPERTYFTAGAPDFTVHYRQLSTNLGQSRTMNDYNSSFKYNLSQAKSIYSGGDGKFGLSFENVKKQYFKEYDVELYGRHSPGPMAYSPDSKLFQSEKYDNKTMPKEKRVCPIVPKHHLLNQISPFSYNKQISSFQKHSNITQYFGSKAERIVDARLFGQQHAYIVQKGLY